MKQTQDGGPYTLHVVADPVDAPPAPELHRRSCGRAQSRPDRPDPGILPGDLAHRPVRRSGPDPEQGHRGRDQDGQAWPVQASDYEETQARVSYLFDGFLPAGHYIVELPEQAG